MTHDDTNPHPVDSDTRVCCGGIGAHTADCTAVHLDPPAPEIDRWQEFADREYIIYHDGNAEKIIPFPRPAWAYPDGDIIGAYLTSCYYTSEFAHIPLQYSRGDFDDSALVKASIDVRAKLCGDGKPIVGLGIRQFNPKTKKWTLELSQGLSPAEALDLIAVLQAAVALFGSGPEGAR
jgi:hypothetical protein